MAGATRFRHRCTVRWPMGLRLGVFPAFDPPEVLGIGFAGRQVIRNRRLRAEGFVEARGRTLCTDVDAEKLRTPVERLRHPRKLEPTVRTREMQVGRSVLDQFLGGLEKVQVPALPIGRSLGCDGTRFELFAESAMHWCNLGWWCDE